MFGINGATRRYIEDYEKANPSPDDAWGQAKHDRDHGDPKNENTDQAAAEHYLFTRKEVGGLAKDYGEVGAVGGALGWSALTLGYDAIKAAGFAYMDNVDPMVGEFLLKGLVSLTSDKEDTLPSRPTWNGVAAGLSGAVDGAVESDALSPFYKIMTGDY